MTDENVRPNFEDIVQPVIARASQFADVGISKQREHANFEVTL